MTCDDVRDQDLVAHYVHRRLSDADRDQFEEHFIGCESCFAEVQDYRVLRQGLAESPAATTIPATAPAAAWWRAVLPAFVLAGAGAVIALALYLPRSSVPASSTDTAAGTAPATSEPVSVDPVPAGPSRMALVGQLARVEPPEYLPPNLRNASGPDDALFKRAMARYQAKQYDEAATALRALRASGPDSAETLFYLGVSDLMSGRVTDALASLETAAAMRDLIYEEDARFFLAKALLSAQDVARARIELARVVALDGDRQQAARSLIDAIDALPAR